MVSDHARGLDIKEEVVNPMHPTMMAAVAAGHIKDMRDDAVRDGRARVARRTRRASHRAAAHRRHGGSELIEQHA
jgi:hypothetical protein